MALRIGILLDSFDLKKWQEEILLFIINNPNLQLDLLILRKNQPLKKKSQFKFFVFRAMRFIDQKLFTYKNDAFSSMDYSFLANEVKCLFVEGRDEGINFKFFEKDVEKIKDYKLDLIIRFGFGIIKGEILESAKFGVWSLHHGDNSVNRGGPPAFWEVVNNEEVTGVTLQRLSKDLDGGQVILKSFIKTDATSFYRNQNNIFWAGVELFTSALCDLSQGKITKSKFPPTFFYSYPLYKNPGNKDSLQIFMQFWIRRISEILKELFYPPKWKIFYKYTTEEMERSLFRYKEIKMPKGYEAADPFVINNGNHHFIFFEEITSSTAKGHISYFSFDNNGNILNPKPKKIIEEHYHLSYPFIFKEKENFLMIPEAADSNEVWIYKAVQFPDKWEKWVRIFNNKSIYDPTLYFHNGMWYLFGTEKTNVGSSRDQYLFIYFSDNLFSTNWTPHPMNPVMRDARRARPAGKIFKRNGILIRPSQISAPKYGYGIQFNEILELSETAFREKPLDQILPKWKKGLLAAHTINFEENFSVVDAQGL